MVKKDRLKGIEFSEKSYGFRKFLSIILFIAMFFGWTFLIGYNIYIAVATAQIRVHPQGFSGEFSNSTMNFTGEFIVENDHFGAITIEDLNISMTISTDNGTELGKTEVVQDIPAGKNTTLSIPLLSFDNITEYTPLEYLALYNSLTTTTYLHLDVSITLKYGLYEVYLDINLKTEWGGFI